jgi:hypothetical protein
MRNGRVVLFYSLNKTQWDISDYYYESLEGFREGLKWVHSEKMAKSFDVDTFIVILGHKYEPANYPHFNTFSELLETQPYRQMIKSLNNVNANMIRKGC